MSDPSRTQRLIAPLVALALLLAPLTPGMASAHGMPTGSADAHAAHAGAAQTTTDESRSAPCGKHDACHGACCASCAQCSATTPGAVTPVAVVHPVFAPSGASRFTSHLSSPSSRPPQAG
jgi:hypothetical protein